MPDSQMHHTPSRGQVGTPLFLMPTYDAASPEHIAPPSPSPVRSGGGAAAKSAKAGKSTAGKGGGGGGGNSPADSLYSYLAAAVGMPFFALPQSKAYVMFGNYTMPPYLGVQVTSG